MEDISAFTTKQHVHTLEINWILSTWQMLFFTVLVIEPEVRTNVNVPAMCLRLCSICYFKTKMRLINSIF